MRRTQCVLAVVALYVGLAHSWDFAVGLGDQLIFHTNDGREVHRLRIQSRNLGGLAYDVVHNRMLYVDKQNNNDTICVYNLSSNENECFIGRNGRNILSIAYDPATEKVFFTDANEKSINSISLKRGYEKNIYENLLIQLYDRTPDDIAVDSCQGYVYWSKKEYIEDVQIERALFDGSAREALCTIDDPVTVNTFTIDPQTQEIYCVDNAMGNRMYRSDMNGKYISNYIYAFDYEGEVEQLTVSKDYLYYVNKTGVWRFSKNDICFNNFKEISKFNTNESFSIAANYKIHDQIKGIQDCDALSNLLPTITKATSNTGDWCDACVNYCLHGNCSVNYEGLPKCSCNAGYLGERCEVSACYGYCLNDGECSLNENSVPVCQCKGGYSGDRCHGYDCLNYCLRGNCSLSDEGHPICSCDVGYSGERCEVSACIAKTTANVT